MSNSAWILLPEMPDPDLEVGGHLTLERADGRSVWRARLVCTGKYPSADPLDDVMGYEFELETEN